MPVAKKTRSEKDAEKSRPRRAQNIRPAKLTDEAVKEIAKQLTKGTPQFAVADFIGVSKRLLQLWMQIGQTDRLVEELRSAIAAGETSEDDAIAVLEDTGMTAARARGYLNDEIKLKHPVYRDLARISTKSKSSFVIKCLESISNERTTSWTRFAWLLERRHPEEFGAISRAAAGGKEEDGAHAASVRRSSGLLQEILKHTAARGVDAQAVKKNDDD